MGCGISQPLLPSTILVPSSSSPTIANVRGTYVLNGVFGEGAHSRVWKGKHKTTQELVAIKEMSTTQLEHNSNFYEELRILNTITAHDHIVHIIEAYHHKALGWLVLPAITGGDVQVYFLSSRAKPDNARLEVSVAEVIAGVVRALNYCHSVGIAHLDVKPENILLRTNTPPLHAMLTDFGSAISFDAATPLAMIDGDLVGTPVYVAPEIVNKKYSPPQADMWSTGMTMYSLLTGDLYFDAPTTELTLHRITSNKIILPPTITQRTSTGCQNILQRLVRRNPTERITSSQALVHPWIVALGKLDEQMAVPLADEPSSSASIHIPPRPFNAHSMTPSTIAILTTTTSQLVTSVVAEAAANAATNLDAHTTHLNSKITKTKITVEHVGEATAMAFTHAVEKIETNATKAEHAVQATVEQKLAQGEQAVTKVETKVDETITKVETKVDETITKVETKVDETVTKVETKVDETVTKVETKVDETITKVETKVDDTVTKVETKVETKVDHAIAKADETATKVETKVDKTISAAGNTAGAAVDAANNTVAEITNAASNASVAVSNAANAVANTTVSASGSVEVSFGTSSSGRASCSGDKHNNVSSPSTNARPLSAASSSSAISSASESSLSSNDETAEAEVKKKPSVGGAAPATS